MALRTLVVVFALLLATAAALKQPKPGAYEDGGYRKDGTQHDVVERREIFRKQVAERNQQIQAQKDKIAGLKTATGNSHAEQLADANAAIAGANAKLGEADGEAAKAKAQQR
eukprot:gnl/TRDRNA2_/TRDRNA2_180759_c0_seq1.p2 gnl/TRDRNA2_/TRDRNA2_180759_c0~~gnl/TRDRNA2_/TRDRNA2_180759_c0_seq1.p2  ORF type:complete len:112 (+),score=32.41 gnl/TRDRNA2_/TRDRNA2_180759_c0_seq1:73-408(+)